MGSLNTSQDANTLDKQDFSSKVEKVENTPFTIIEDEGEFFGVLGNHRLTQKYKYKKDCVADLEDITWNRIVQVIWVVAEKLKQKEEIENAIENLKKGK